MGCQHNSLTGCHECNLRSLEKENRRLTEQNERLRSALNELAMNAENLVKGGLPHFTRKEFADTVAWRARHALGEPTTFTSPVGYLYVQSAATGETIKSGLGREPNSLQPSAREACRSKGLCGWISGEGRNMQACILVIGHDSGIHELDEGPG